MCAAGYPIEDPTTGNRLACAGQRSLRGRTGLNSGPNFLVFATIRSLPLP